MRRLFRTFEKSGVDFLLISGQASILYGAAEFSEDIDLWVEPSKANFRRLFRSLADCRARVHKLTPRPTPKNVRFGHGFHFRVPQRGGDLYLDVLGAPPRVGPFSRSRLHAEWWPTEWGRIPVVCIEDLVELKKTRRLRDYDVITNLVEIRMAREVESRGARLRWAAANSFRPEERRVWLQRAGCSVPLTQLRRAILRDLDRHQRADTSYWRKRIADLKRLRREEKLLPEGALVSEIL